MQRSTTAGLVATLTLALAGGCTPADDGGPTASQETRSATGATAATADAQAAVLTDANLDAYARALRKEAEIIRRPGRGTHYGVSISVHGSDGESGEVLEAAGMTVQEYHAVHGQVESVFRILNFQGRIGPPISLDLDAAPEWKEKLEGDAFATLPPESAAALRRHMDTLAPLWSDIVALTAQHGQ